MHFFVLLFVMCLLIQGQASASGNLPEPTINTCTHQQGIRCSLTCARALGEQCLIARINFAGTGTGRNQTLLRARFLTCINANIDLQLTSLAVERHAKDGPGGPLILTAKANSSSDATGLRGGSITLLDDTVRQARIARTGFEKLLNSGKQHVEISLNLKQCGTGGGENRCHLSGTLTAVTDPNIRCDFHDKNASGAYLPATLQNSVSSTNNLQPVGRIGQ